ncbi:MAG: hypothetical protein OJF49_004018 [Ktedonobacterales bacterium]|jgi:hypothetical protein|nr:MAG: hypothetical protein OJF49_004018 [Ktedonobacterales bacterium]
MALNGVLILIAVATAADGILAGASLDQSIKQLPARHKMGMVAFSAYSTAADLGSGIVWYATLGIGAAFLTIVAAVVVFLQAAPAAQAWPIYVAAVLSVAHSLATTQAAPTNFRQRHAAGDEKQLAAIFAKFARWQTVRATLQVLTFAAALVALIAYAAR